MTIESVMLALYASEINCSIESFWNCGWIVKFGDSWSGFEASANVRSLDEAAVWLDREARERCPNSTYAKGRA